MRAITADYIFPISSEPIQNGVLEIDDHGQVLSLGTNLKSFTNLEKYNGVLVPGFVNAHCHLELSYLKSKIQRKTGLAGFVKQIQHVRTLGDEDSLKSAVLADEMMWNNGIVAVGDISNRSVTFELKRNSRLKYHTFIEVFGLIPGLAQQIFHQGESLYHLLRDECHLPASIVPHAPYSLSRALFRLLEGHNSTTGDILSIHNQESKEENVLSNSNSGLLFEFFRELGLQPAPEFFSRTNSLPTVANWLPRENKLLLVHNTYSQADDIHHALRRFPQGDLFWVMCPGANVFIEDQLPDIQLFYEKGLQIALGTDSLASNDTLSILEEMKIVSKAYPGIPFRDVIRWATLSGARALGMDTVFGSFEQGKQPGVNLIENMNLDNFDLTNASVRKLA